MGAHVGDPSARHINILAASCHGIDAQRRTTLARLHCRDQTSGLSKVPNVLRIR